MHDVGYVAAGYLVTAISLGGYVVRLLARARRARRRAAALAGGRPRGPRAGS